MESFSTKVNLITPRFSYLERFSKDALKIRTSKLLIQVDCLPYHNSVLLQNLPINTLNLSGAVILISRRYSRSSCSSAFYKIGVLKTLAKF